jgi:hypothetical protein
MPKIKDLGINIVPPGMRPPEIGGGGGCGDTCDFPSNCFPSFPLQPTDPGCVCLTAVPPPPMYMNRNPTDPGCDCITTGGTRYMNQSDPGCQCITTPGPCAMSACPQISMQQSDATCQCITQPGPCGGLTRCGGGTIHCPGGSQCTFGSVTVTITPLTPQLPAGALTRDDIAALRAQLKQHLDNIDVAEKALLPKTLEEVDAREKALQAEMDQLKARRAELKK